MDAPEDGDERTDGEDADAAATGPTDGSGEATDERAEPDAESEDEPGPTPQSAALRRQQRYIGVAGALLGGLALATGTFQRFPGTPALAVVAGIVGTGTVLWLARQSVFPGEPATGE